MKIQDLGFLNLQKFITSRSFSKYIIKNFTIYSMESKIAKLKQNEEELNFNQRFLNGLLDFVKKDENSQIVSHDK